MINGIWDSPVWFKNHIEERKKHDSYLPTNIKELDKYIDGFYKETFVAVGARPGIGKTTLLINIMLNNLNVPMIFFTTEFSKEVLLEKIISIHTLISHKSIRTNPAFLNGKLDSILVEMKKYNIAIVDNTHPSTQEIKEFIAMMEPTPRLVFIDYFQNVHVENYEKVSSYSRNVEELCRLARIYKCTVICSSQFHRLQKDDYSKDDREIEPNISDFKETGKLEEAAHLALLLYQRNNKLMIKIGKNRNGETGTFPLGVLWDSGRIIGG